MPPHDAFDRALVHARAAEFRDQVERRLSGALSEEEFRPLRLMNGLYLLLHGYMLRAAIPYGTLDSAKLETLADIADRWDRGYVHFTTRQNAQFHWPRLVDVPDILDALADAGLHAIQTSGSCVRAVTADPLAGAAPDEIEDPRPTAELVRRYFSAHAEFCYLPRKFKIAVSGGPVDRAAIRVHDIGLEIVRDAGGRSGYRVFVGGGLGRTPMIGRELRAFLPSADLLPYLEAVLRVYNAIGRRDNKYKARIKITLHEMGLEAVRARIETAFAAVRGAFGGADRAAFRQIAAGFTPPEPVSPPLENHRAQMARNAAYRRFVDTNTRPHRRDGYRIVGVSLKSPGGTPGDITSAQMRALAAIARDLAHDDIRAGIDQNLVLPHVPLGHLPQVFAALREAGLATANAGLVSDVVACPGMDYCDLATARSLPLADAIQSVFAARADEIGPLRLRISGCINACAHHHTADIGVLGLDKRGAESYQITLGGSAGRIGERTGPGFAADRILPALERVITTYLDERAGPGERFADCFGRVGIGPFRAALHAPREIPDAA